MASEATANGSASAPEALTPAQKLMEKHAADETHRPTVEEVVDEEDIIHPPPSLKKQADGTSDPGPLMTEKAAGKQKAQDPDILPTKKAAANAPLNTQSEELFPALGPAKPRGAPVAPAWGKKPASLTTNGVNGSANGAASSNTSSRASTPASGMGTPGSFAPSTAAAHRVPLPSMSLPGKHAESITFAPSQLLRGNQLKKPMTEILRDINRKSKAKVEYKQGSGGNIIFEGTGPIDAVRNALKEVANELGSKQSVKVPVPASVRAHIIGRQGSKIQEISKRTGAKIQVPKQEDSPAFGDDDESATIDVLIEGNAVTAEMARQEIENIVNERTSTVNLRLKDIPAEYYPFLAGPHNSLVNSLEDGRDIRVQIPHYHTWNTQAPPQCPKGQPVPFMAQAGLPIQISGERNAAREAQAQLERQVEQLRRELAIDQTPIDRSRHQFIVGDKGGSLHDFLEETGCTVIMPPSSDDSETIYIVGPPDKIVNGVNKLEDLASSMQMATVDAAKQHGGAQAHARNVTRYLKQRQVIEELERQHEASIILPTLAADSNTMWEIFARNGKNAMKARTDIMNLISSHPPSRVSNMVVDPFYHQFLQERNAQQIRDDMGVQLVFPDETEESPELILVYEGTAPSADYVLPRGAPAPAEIQAYKRALQEAEQFIESLTSAQQEIVARDVEAPPKFHDKIRRFVDRQQQAMPRDEIPVQVLFGARRPEEARRRSNHGIAMRGPNGAVDDLTAQILAFIEQEEKDELERGYTTTFDFPQKYASFLVGKRGENIRNLREEFDVDIQINDGKVLLKGPKAKADSAKTHILALAKKLEDEATHTLKIKPQYHRDLIGPKGSQVNRLQDRYNVRVNFPRSAAHDDDAATEGAGSHKNYRAQAPDEVIIRGPKRGADEAREELLNLLQWTMDNSYTDSVSVAQSQLPSLIGSGGREMENLRLTSGAQIDVPGRDEIDPSGRAQIRLKGTKKQVEDAKKLIQERAKVFDDTVVKSIEVDKQYHRELIGQGGKTIRSIVVAAGGSDSQRDITRMVRFPPAGSDSSTIRVEGPKAVVEKVVATIQSRVSTSASNTTETLEISPDKHRLLIGAGGETRKNLESKFNVTLNIPNRNVTGAARSQVQIIGEAAAVETAKDHILELVKGQEGETIQVPRHLHHTISDNGQFFRRLRNDHRVTVDHAGQQPPARPTQVEGGAGKARKGANGASLPLITDEDSSAGAEETYSWDLVDNNPTDGSVDTSATIPWILRGHADNLPRARQAVEAAIETASKPSVTGYLILPDPSTYRLVVGTGGATINSLRKKTGTKVVVPKDQAKGEAIEITGSKDGVEEAKAQILEIVKKGGGRRN